MTRKNRKLTDSKTTTRRRLSASELAVANGGVISDRDTGRSRGFGVYSA